MSKLHFITARDFRSLPEVVWDKLSSGEGIIVTNNSKPMALLLGTLEWNFEVINIPECDFEETLASVRQAKLMRDFTQIREEAVERGFISDDGVG